ncbi:MAG TPA: adenosylmethionine--8-amino-7-oxononanoate transaminase [Burkholderiaceae bacterium]|nr:adenosylmethionine--8-amino-7-oxononanoate transaminase [Burkholderiaceae bacterium]
MTVNRDLVARTLRSVWHPCTQMKLHERLPMVPVSHGQGAWLYDFEGRRYLDAISSWWVNLFGHANARINAAVVAQLERLEHVILAGFTHEPAVLLSERLSAVTGGRLGHCFFASDGSSSVEIALKMSHHVWRNRGQPEKSRFAHLTGAYHGETTGALSVGDVALFRDAYAPLLRSAIAVPSPDWRNARPGESPLQVARRCADALDRTLQQRHREVAALIVEPLVQCANGMGMYDPEYLRLARALCDRHQVHLIADEIAVGFGRTGTFLACEQAGILPDLLCLSKGITAGYLPLSVVLSTDAIYEAFYHDEVARGFLHSHSYTGNPLACAAALATLSIFDQDAVIEANRQRAAHIDELARPIAAHPRVRDFRRTGMIWAFEVDAAEPLFARRFAAAALERELLLRPIGNTVYFMPPYVIDEAQSALLAERALELIDQVA